MATYLVLNVVFMTVVAVALRLRFPRPSRVMLRPLIVLLALTVIFDNLLVGLDIVSYSQARILGLYIGVAPIEDFAYAVLAFIVVPNLWNRFNT